MEKYHKTNILVSGALLTTGITTSFITGGIIPILLIGASAGMSSSGLLKMLMLKEI